MLDSIIQSPGRDAASSLVEPTGYPVLPRFFRSYIWHGLPFAGRLYSLLGLDGIDDDNPTWRHAPKRLGRGRFHGYLVDLDLRQGVEREFYFKGYHYERDLQLSIDAFVQPGDTFIDVGANIGFVLLHAANRVGPHGRVIANEPQPQCCARIAKTLEANRIAHCELHNVGLSDRSGSLTLTLPGGVSALGTFAWHEAASGSAADCIEADVLRGDDLVGERIVGELMIKLDVEGFELFAIRGFENTIKRYRPVIFTENQPTNLRRAGVEPSDLLDHFLERGYRGYLVLLEGRWIFRRIRLREITSADDLLSGKDGRPDAEQSILWVPHESNRLQLLNPKTAPRSA
jgi:FkbM family methyltransferase